MTDLSFDLLSESWIRVRRLTGDITELSLTGVLQQSHECVALAGELPTQDVAMLRLLLAVVRRSHPDARTTADWGDLWRKGAFDMTPIDAYLNEHRQRFDLLSAQTPFYQVAGLSTAKGSMTDLARLVSDVPAGHQFFTTRAGAALASMSFPEAARWVVHTHAYDPSGIKSGALGDDRVRGGKGYPIGIAWCGWLGVTVVEGQNLFETLLLNLPLGVHRSPLGSDLPVWERPPQTAAAEARSAPYGPIDLLTWQSRRIRIGHDGSRATGVLIANGDALHPRDRFHEEFMTSWRLSEAQMKGLGSSDPVYMPRGHQPDRSMWRGLEGTLAVAADAASARSFKTGRWLEWLGRLRLDEELPRDLPVRMRAIAMHYGAQSSVTDDVSDDALTLSSSVLGNPDLRTLAVDAVRDADAGVRHLASLGGELGEAAGISGDGVDAARSVARQLGYAALDAPYRTWLAALCSDSERDLERASWQRLASRLLLQVSRDLVRNAGQAAWIGREVGRGNDRVVYLDAALAELSFYRKLRQALPAAHRHTDVKETVS